MLETKENVESTIKYLINNFRARKPFGSFPDINVHCHEWLQKVNSRIHGTTHEIPYERLKNE
jgi:transposase